MEICFITDILRKRVLAEIRKTEPCEEYEFVMSAQHTHAAPSGYTHYALYNMPTPGFVPEVLESYVAGAVRAYQEAKKKLKDCTIEFKQARFDDDTPVSFNRSLNAYLQNPEVQKEGLGTEKITAKDPFMRALLFKQGEKYISGINWFAVHTTSLRNTNSKVSPDNKGYASLEVEDNLKEDFTAIFAQGDAGDISPNWIWDSSRHVMRGHFEDDVKNGKFNGKLQATKFLEILKQTEKMDVSSHLDSVLAYQDFSDIIPDREFLPSDAPDYAATTPASHGVAFAEGTAEGPGVPKPLGFLLKIFATIVKVIDLIRSFNLSHESKKKIWNFYNNQEPKFIFAEPGNRRVFGITNIGKLAPLSLFDPMVGTMAAFYKNGSMREHTWTQQILPVQLIRIGEVLLLALPAEVTTIAGLRLKRQLLKMFENHGIKEVISTPYSNAFCGYIVTPEEYATQSYEGGHCVFGKWALPAFQTVIKKLAIELLKEESQRDLSWSLETPVFSEKEILGRTYN